MPQKTIAIAIEGDIPEDVQILAQGHNTGLGTRPATDWAVIRIPVEDARTLAKSRAVYQAEQGIGGWHYTRRPLKPQDIG